MLQTSSSIALGKTQSALVQASMRDCGICFDLGAVNLRLRSDCGGLAEHLQCAYAEFPFTTTSSWDDVSVQVNIASGVRRWLKPQAVISCDGEQRFEPFPVDSALPLFDWGCNWWIGQRSNNLFLLHAGVVERSGLALVMPALPGSGKSTLTAALSQTNWRMLSDEFGAYDPVEQQFRPLLKPAALKNQSIDVIRQFSPHAMFGPEFPKTRKGTVAHLAASADAVARRHEMAKPGAFLFPKWRAGSRVTLEPVDESRLFSALTFNSFNYAVLGAVSFKAAVSLARRCPAWQLEYSDLGEALAAIDGLWPKVLEHHANWQA